MIQDKPLITAIVSVNEEYRQNTWTVCVDIEPYEQVLALRMTIATQAPHGVYESPCDRKETHISIVAVPINTR